jgi:hypothetical protein
MRKLLLLLLLVMVVVMVVVRGMVLMTIIKIEGLGGRGEKEKRVE